MLTNIILLLFSKECLTGLIQSRTQITSSLLGCVSKAHHANLKKDLGRSRSKQDHQRWRCITIDHLSITTVIPTTTTTTIILIKVLSPLLLALLRLPFPLPHCTESSSVDEDSGQYTSKQERSKSFILPQN